MVDLDHADTPSNMSVVFNIIYTLQVFKDLINLCFVIALTSLIEV